ncbi:MAG: SMP-30/gluconolactonase/LRE family protein [Planctomycetia bacterium]|nr:SMP-30/gluconolactonase/LRE family protein [Planctomycetia bacterium]
MSYRSTLAIIAVFLGVGSLCVPAHAAELPDATIVSAVELLEVDHYCEGVVFDAQGRGYLSNGKQIVQFTLDGQAKVWAETGSPNGHKILADGTHLVCDASHHALLRLSADGNLYVAHYGMQQVQVLSPEGKLLPRYPGGNVTTSNVAFGGPKHDQLFVTGGLGPEGGKGGLFRLDFGVKGLVILSTATK